MTIRIMLLLGLTLLLAGCPLEDDDGLSEAEVRRIVGEETAGMQADLVASLAKVDELEGQLAALDADVQTAQEGVGDRVTFLGPQLPAGVAARAAVAPPAGSIGTAMRMDSELATSRGVSVKMDSNYFVDFSFRRTDTGPQTFVNTRAVEGGVYYESTDCGQAAGDQPLVDIDKLGVQAQQQGAVVSIYDYATFGEPEDTSAFRNPDNHRLWEIPPGATTEDIAIGSRVASSGLCLSNEFFGIDEGTVIRPIPNDQATTGVPNEPWDGVPSITGV